MNHSSSGQRQLQKPGLLQLLVWNGLESFKLPRLSLDAIRVPGSAFYFVSSLAFMVGYLFVNASQGVGDEIDVTPIFSAFMRVPGLFRADFSKSPHRGCPTPKRAKTAKKPLPYFYLRSGFLIF